MFKRIKDQKQDMANTNQPPEPKLINMESNNIQKTNNQDKTPKLFDSDFNSDKLINSTLFNSNDKNPDLRKVNEPNGSEENKNCNKREKIKIYKKKTKKPKIKKSQKIKKIKTLKEKKKREEQVFAFFSKKFKKIKNHKKNKKELISCSPNEIKPVQSVVCIINNGAISDVAEFDILEDLKMHNSNNQDEIDELVIEKYFYDYSCNHCRGQILNDVNTVPVQNNMQYNQNEVWQNVYFLYIIMISILALFINNQKSPEFMDV